MNDALRRAPLDPTPFHAVRRHGRLWRRFAIQAIVRETHYRTHVIATTLVGLMQLAVSLIPLLLLYTYTDTINGWSRGDVIALAGVYQVSLAILWLAVETNMDRFGSIVREGELDLILIRPVSAQFYVTLRWVKPAELFMILTGIIVTAIGLRHAGGAPGAASIAQAALLIACGVVLITCAWSFTVYTAFWFTSTGPMPMVFADLLQTGRFPIAFYPAAIRFVLAFVFPVGFAATFPAEALVGRASWTLVAVGIGLSAAALLALRALWQFAVRFYSSASS